MDLEPYRSVLEELALRTLAKANIPNVLESAFPQQLNFILDPANKKTLFCTRRSAKSFTAGLALVHTALQYPGTNSLFIGLTRGSAEAIIWKDVLKVIDAKYQLGAVFNETKLQMTLPNGSCILATGVDVDEKEMNKLLGRKFKLVCIDEASMYTISLESLINLIEPATVDEEGSICLMGTASNFPRGVFYDITTGQRRDWKLFQWSAHQNPHVARQWQAKLDEIAAIRPGYMETPQFKQWYLNQWVVDEEKLVYKFDVIKNLTKIVPQLPHDGWTYVLGVDTGWEDASAFVLTAYHVNDPFLYVLETFHESKMTFDRVTDKIHSFMRDDKGQAKPFAPHRVIIDGANKQGVESMRHRSAIPFEYADKQDKVTFIELCNSDLIEGRIKVLDNDNNRPLWNEMMSLVWQTDGDKIKYPKKEHPSLPNHLCDAFLYSWRCGYHYSSEPAVKKLVIGSREWYIKQADDIWERERERLERGDSRGDWAEEGNLGELG